MPLLLPLSPKRVSGTPLALLSLGVALRSATLLSATLEPVAKQYQKCQLCATWRSNQEWYYIGGDKFM